MKRDLSTKPHEDTRSKNTAALTKNNATCGRNQMRTMDFGLLTKSSEKLFSFMGAGTGRDQTEIFAKCLRACLRTLFE